MTCAIKRAKRGAVRVRCRVVGASGELSARLVRGRKVLAKTKRNGSGRLTLRAARKARSGRYAVVLSQAGETVARVALRLR